MVALITNPVSRKEYGVLFFNAVPCWTILRQHGMSVVEAIAKEDIFFGPLILLAPVVAAVEGYKHHKRGLVQFKNAWKLETISAFRVVHKEIRQINNHLWFDNHIPESVTPL
jgi:hypothetical protein